MAEQQKLSKSAGRRMFLKLFFPEIIYMEQAMEQHTWKPHLDGPTKAGLVLRGAALLAACGAPQPAIDQSGQTIDFLFPNGEILDEKIINGKSGEYKIVKIDPQSLKVDLTNSPVTNADREIQAQRDNMNNALDDTESVIQLQKKNESGQWESVMLPGSIASKSVISQFGSYFSQFGLSQDENARAQFFAAVFNPTMQTPEKMAAISQFINVPDATIAADIMSKLDVINMYSGDVPDNAPWDFIFDAYTSASTLNSTDVLGQLPEKTGNMFSLFVPKDNEKRKTKEELGKMFIPIGELVRPTIYTADYQVTIPASDPNNPPTYQTKSRMVTYYGPDDKRNKTVDYIPNECKDHPEMMVGAVLPIDVASQLGGAVLTSQQIDPSRVDYGFIPKGMDENKGIIEPVVFFDNPTNFEASKVLVANDGAITDRINTENKSWITKVSGTIDALKNDGATEAFKYGLLPTKHAFARIFKGRKINSASGQDEFPNLALFPNDQGLVDTLAGLYMQGKSLDQWGVATYQGGPDNSPILALQRFSGTNNLFGILENIQWTGDAGKIEPGAFYNIMETVKLGSDVVVPYYETKEGNVFTESVQGVGNRLQDLVDKVMVVGTKNELEETMKTLGKIAPWALIAIAALIQPETLITNLWKVLTWVATKIPFLGLASEIDLEGEIMAESPMLPFAVA